MQQAEPFPTYAIFVIAGLWLFVFPLFWCGIVYLISRISGWPILASLYPASRPFVGESFNPASIRMRGFANYKNTVSVGLDPAGLSLEINFFFKVGHKPIFIPWTDIQGEHGGRFLLWSVVNLRAAKAPSIPLRIFTRPENINRLAAFAAAGSGRPFLGQAPS